MILLSLGRSLYPFGLGRHFVSSLSTPLAASATCISCSHVAQSATTSLTRCTQYSLRFWLASTVVPVTSTASFARAGVACHVNCCGKKVRWARCCYLSCATSFWRWSNPWVARQLCCMQVGGLALLSFIAVCCSVYLPSFLLLLLFKACFRYASDAVDFACTALELLLAEGLRAVVAILCCIRDL